MSAIAHVEQLARGRRDQALLMIKNVQQMSNISAAELQLALMQLKKHGRIALHFHPDRLDSRGFSVVQGLLADGIYKSQFETHISNGLLSPELGGPRDHFENQLFGNVYKGTKLRPKYGALDINLHPDGPAPRFGSCYLLTNTEVSRRSTFCYLDSYRHPKEKGTFECFEDVFSALLSESFERHYGLGKADFKPGQLVQHLGHHLQPLSRRFSQNQSANLDHYIEAQIHGNLALASDIEMLVADPCYQDTETGDLLQSLCKTYDIALAWHGGFRLDLVNVPKDFRGPSMPVLAERVAIDDAITAHAIGQAAANLVRAPKAWRDRGNVAQVLQEFKLLWHVLVKYGQVMPAPPAEFVANTDTDFNKNA